MDDFKKCTNTIFDGDFWDISCKLNLWSVEGKDKNKVQDEALHYFRKYKTDGEYYQIIGGKNPYEKLKKEILE